MIVILTGAGISKESGIDTFRDADGLWKRERIEDVANPRSFAKNPDRVHEFYNRRRRQLLSPEVAPNAAHFSLAELEEKSAEEVLVITQNVDDLHERAGTGNLLHMHGEMLRKRCTSCHGVFPCRDDLSKEDACPGCGKTGTLRPHIVWFEEMPFHMNEIEIALSRCRVFVSIGTSGNVYPAAGFAALARSRGAHVIELNLEPSSGTSTFHEGRYGKATEIVPEWVRDILESQGR